MKRLIKKIPVFILLSGQKIVPADGTSQSDVFSLRLGYKFLQRFHRKRLLGQLMIRLVDLIPNFPEKKLKPSLGLQ